MDYEKRIKELEAMNFSLDKHAKSLEFQIRWQKHIIKTLRPQIPPKNITLSQYENLSIRERFDLLWEYFDDNAYLALEYDLEYGPLPDDFVGTRHEGLLLDWLDEVYTEELKQKEKGE